MGRFTRPIDPRLTIHHPVGQLRRENQISCSVKPSDGVVIEFT